MAEATYNRYKERRFFFKSRERIKSRKDIRNVRKKGDKFIGKLVVVWIYGKAENPGCRLGIIIGKRYGNAVKRNRFKRLCREVFRLNKYSFNIKAEILVTPKLGREAVKYSELEKDMLDVFKKANILN